jgi:hypothetical protein
MGWASIMSGLPAMRKTKSLRRTGSSMFEEYGYRSYRLRPPLSDHSRLAADASFERHDVGSLLTGCDRGSMRSGARGEPRTPATHAAPRSMW